MKTKLAAAIALSLLAAPKLLQRQLFMGKLMQVLITCQKTMPILRIKM